MKYQFLNWKKQIQSSLKSEVAALIVINYKCKILSLKGGTKVEQKLVHAFYGDGKGKTSAAIGQGIRALGADLKVIMIQFLKNTKATETVSLSRLEPDFKVFRFEKDREKAFYKLTDQEKKEVEMEIENAMKFAQKIYETKECDVLILDEILTAVDHNIIQEETLKEFILSKPNEIELIITGRQLSELLKKSAHYITLMTNIKYPYTSGFEGRKGIDF